MPNAISVLAVADRGSMYDPSAVFYMSKLATGPEAAGMVDIDAPPAANIAAVAKAKGCSPQDVTVVILDRPRHEELITEVRDGGRPDPPDHRRRRGRRDHGRPRGHRHRPDARHRRHAGGHHRRLRAEVPRRRHPGQARAARRRRTPPRARRRPRPGPRAHHRRPGLLGRRVLRRHRDHRRRAGRRACGTCAGARPLTRWSCAPARARSAASRASTSCGSCAPTPRSTSASPG